MIRNRRTGLVEFWFTGVISKQTTITGTVTQSTTGDGIVRINGIIGLDHSDVVLLGDPSFSIAFSIP